MKSNIATIGVLIVGVAIAADYVWHGRQVADLRREIAALREQAPSPERAESLAPRPRVVEIVQAAPEAPAPAPREERARDSDEDRRARWKDDEIAHQTAVEAGFASETVDREWAPVARQDLNAHVAALLPASASLGDIDCRSSMCRMELAVPDAATSQKFMKSAFLSPDQHIWDGPGFVEPAQAKPDGSLAVVVYLAREGTSFPE